MRTQASSLPQVLLAGLLGLLAGSPAAHAGMPYQDGDHLVITGLVTDAQGRALADVSVVLEASRAGFDVRTFSREKHDAQRVSATTNEHGEYSLEWAWAGYYNHFELQVGLPYKRYGSSGATPSFLALDQQDLTPRLKGGSPVIAAVTVRDTSPLEALRAFLAGLRGADQRATYDTMGRPEQLDRLLLPDGVEETWWYFEAGKAYRFMDGKQLDASTFDPVRRF